MGKQKYTQIQLDLSTDTATIKEKKKKGFSRSYRGLLYVAISAFTFSIMSLLVKFANNNGTGLSPLSLACYRGFFSFLFNFLYSLFVKKQPIHKVLGFNLGLTSSQRWALVGRCIAGTISISAGYTAMTLLPLGDASSLIFTSPIVTFVLARIFLKERIDGLDLFCGLICLVGVVFVARPAVLFGNSTSVPATSTANSTGATATQHTAGVFMSLVAALASASAYVFVRKLGDVPAEIVVGSFMFVVCWATGFLALMTHTMALPVSLLEFAMTLAIGFCGFAGQLYMTWGFSLEQAGPASVMRYIDVIFAFIWSATLLQEEINPWSVFGAFVIMASAITITLNKVRKLQHGGGGGGDEGDEEDEKDEKDETGGGQAGGVVESIGDGVELLPVSCESL